MNKYQEAYNDIELTCLCIDSAERAKEYLNAIRELVEKATTKKLHYEADGYWDGQLVYDTAICPCCGRRFEVDCDEHSKYCPSCGQALDWSEEE